MRLPEWATRLLLLVLACALGLLLAEGGARVLFAREFGDVLQLDDTLLYRPIPNAVKHHHLSAVNGGTTVEVRFNSQGFRGPELRPAGSAPRVVVYGDSFIDGYFAAEPATFCARLEQHLAQALGASVEVVNAGVRGYGPDQVAIKLAQELPWLRPDLVVVAFYAGNDFGDVVRDQLFTLDSSGAAVRRAARPAARYVEEFQSAQRGPFLWRALERIRDARARTAAAAGGGTDSAHAQQVRGWLQDAEREHRASLAAGEGEAAIFHDGEDVDIAIDPASATAQHKVRLTAAVLRHLEAVARGAGVPLLYVLIPPPGDLIPGFDVYHVDPAAFPGYSPGHLHEAALAVLRQGGAPVVDLTPAFAADPASLFLHADDMHWSPRGQDLAARLVADSVGTLGILPRRSPGS